MQETAVTIRVDSRESRSGVVERLEALGAMVLLELLPSGDYRLGGDPERIVERKQKQDFVASLTDGRLFRQLAEIRAGGQVPLLLLEGDPLSVETQVAPTAIRGALTYLAGIEQVTILPSQSVEDSAELIYSLARQLQKGYQRPGPPSPRRAVTLAEQRRAVVQALPGIGAKTAEALLARFATPLQIAEASIEELTTVRGITRERAERLHAILVDPE